MVVEFLKASRIKNIVELLFRKERIIDYFGDGTQFGFDIKYSVHTLNEERVRVLDNNRAAQDHIRLNPRLSAETLGSRPVLTRIGQRDDQDK